MRDALLFVGIRLAAVLRFVVAVQHSPADLAGVLRDSETGEPVAGALVRLIDLARTAITDRSGQYRFAGVPAGPQHIDCRRIGYQPRLLHVLVPARGTLAIDVAMTALPRHLQTIEVRPTQMLAGRTDVTQVVPERTVSATGIQYHPMLAEPDAFLALGGHAIIMAPEAPNGVHALGGSADQTAFLLNGIPIFSPYHAAGAFSAWNPDAIERIRYSLPATLAGATDALSGIVSGDTRTPQPVLQAAGGLTTTHARLTLDGPAGPGGAGFLVSLRAGFPGAVAPPDEPSYVTGQTSDLLATLERPAWGGRARLLAYDSRNEFRTSAVTARVDPVPSDAPRNAFDWNSRSFGGDWRGVWRRSLLVARVWSASSGVASRWYGSDSGLTVPLLLSVARDDFGASVRLGGDAFATSSAGAAWIRSTRTHYRVLQGNGRPLLALTGRTPVAAVDLSHGLGRADAAQVRVGLTSYRGAERFWLAPRLTARVAVSPTMALAGTLSRGLQFVQSLRNPESIVSTIFPPELDAGAGAAGVPVARSLDAIVSSQWSVPNGAEVRGVLWTRRFHGLVLPAPATAEPFVVDGFAIGSGISSGAGVDLALSGSWYTAVAGYTWQRVRRSAGTVSYIPGHASQHVAEAGVSVFPSPTFSARLAVTLAAGRRGTMVDGGLEWESCNLLDRGCEFGGTPRNDPGTLGRTVLPTYVRVDAGLRKHWHLRVAGRDAQFAVHGTLTNLLSRANVLTVFRPGPTDPAQPLELRPFAPLVVGLDWRF